MFLLQSGEVILISLFNLVKPKAEQLHVVFGKERPSCVMLDGLYDDAEGECVDGGVYSNIAVGI